MIIYSVFDGSEAYYHETKVAAVKDAQNIADHRGEPCAVEMHNVVRLTSRKLAVVLLSGRGWSESSEVVYTAEPKGKKNTEG